MAEQNPLSMSLSEFVAMKGDDINAQGASPAQSSSQPKNLICLEALSSLISKVQSLKEQIHALSNANATSVKTGHWLHAKVLYLQDVSISNEAGIKKLCEFVQELDTSSPDPASLPLVGASAIALSELERRMFAVEKSLDEFKDFSLSKFLSVEQSLGEDLSMQSNASNAGSVDTMTDELGDLKHQMQEGVRERQAMEKKIEDLALKVEELSKTKTQPDKVALDVRMDNFESGLADLYKRFDIQDEIDGIGMKDRLYTEFDDMLNERGRYAELSQQVNFGLRQHVLRQISLFLSIRAAHKEANKAIAENEGAYV